MMYGGSWPFTGGPIERSERLKGGQKHLGANPVFVHNIFLKILIDEYANCNQ